MYPDSKFPRKTFLRYINALCYKTLQFMAKDDLVLIEGRVTEVLAGGNFIVEGDKGLKLTAKLAGKLRRRHIRVILGDHVTVGVSPYDPTHGLITYRGRDPQLNR